MDAAAEPVPSRVGDYCIEGRLGRGGMAEVFRARAPDGRPVVVKRILPEHASDPALCAMLEDEGRHVRALRHPAIVSLLDVGIAEGAPFLVLELVDGVDLGAAVRRAGALPPSAVARIGADVASALAHAHAAGVVHRDVTPGNILLDRKGNARLGDFGIARAPTNQSLTMHGTVKGKPGYLAPEQALGGPVDGRTDLYALGVTLAEALTGRPLFEGEGPAEAAARLGAPPVRVDFAQTVPAALRSVVESCLAPERSLRPSSAEAVLGVLGPLTGGGSRERVAEIVARAATTHTAVLPAAVAPGDTRVVRRDSPSSASGPIPANAVATRGRRRAAWGAVAVVAVLAALALGYRAGRSDRGAERAGHRQGVSSGTLVLENVPLRAKLYVDGAAVPITARQMLLPVAPGSHALTLQTRRGDVFERRVVVPVGGRQIVRIPRRRNR